MLATSNVYSGFLQKLRRYIRRHEMLLGGEPLLVAVSGGIDSMVLLDMLIRLAPTMNLTLGVAHYEHGLRGETSKEDAQFVVETARQHGLKVYVGHGDVKQIAEDHKLSIEEAARRARYTFLRKVARKHRFPVVVTGHTANDNAETVLLNLIRGSGVRGLAAIPPMRQMGEGVILARPLLDFERSEIERYAKEMAIAWREDESNVSVKFVRNRLRSELLPMLQAYNPSIVGTLNTTAEIMRNLEQYLSHSVQTAIERVTVEKSKERLALNLHQIKHFLPAMQTEIVQRGVSQAFDIPPISFSATERALALLYRETGQKADLGAGLTALRDRDALVVMRELPLPPELEYSFSKGEDVEAGRVRLKSVVIPRDRVQFSKNGRVEFFDADKLPDDLVLRSWREGDRFHPLGMEGEKKVSDFLVDSKTPRDRKRHVLVLTANDDIVWVCGMRIDDRVKVTDETTNVLKVEMQVLSPNQVNAAEARGERGRGGKGERSPRGGRGEGGRDDKRTGDRRGASPRDDRREGDRAEGRRDEQPREHRPPDERDRDARERDARPRDERRTDDRSEERSRDDRRPDDRARAERPRDDRGRNDRRRDDRPREDRPKEDRPREDRPRDDRQRIDRQRDDRPREDRPREDRPKEDRQREDRSREDRPREDRQREGRRDDDRERAATPAGGESDESQNRSRDDASDNAARDSARGETDRPKGRKDRGRGSRGRDNRPRDDRSRGNEGDAVAPVREAAVPDAAPARVIEPAEAPEPVAKRARPKAPPRVKPEGSAPRRAPRPSRAKKKPGPDSDAPGPAPSED